MRANLIVPLLVGLIIGSTCTTVLEESFLAHRESVPAPVPPLELPNVKRTFNPAEFESYFATNELIKSAFWGYNEGRAGVPRDMFCETVAGLMHLTNISVYNGY